MNFLDISFWGNNVKSYIVAIAIILLFIGIGKLFSIFVISILKKISSKTKTVIDDIIVRIIEKPFIFGLFIAGFYIAGNYLNLSENTLKIYYNIIELLIVILIIWSLIRFLDAIIEHYLMPIVEKSESELDDQVVPFLRTTIKVIIIIIGAIFIIKDFGYDVTSLVAGLGIGGLAFALAAQPLLTNLFGGIAILADKPFHIGDRIRVDDRFEGYVQQIGMRSTTIKTAKGTTLVIPNSVIASTSIENISTTKDHSIRHTFELAITYNTTIEKVKEAIEIIKDILEKSPYVVKDNDNKYFVSFSGFRDSFLAISVGFTHSIDKVSEARTAINLEIKERFEKAGIEFAFPTQTVYLKNE